MSDNPPLETSLQEQKDKLSKAIARRKSWGRWLGAHDPELLSVYGIIQSHLSEIQRLLILRQEHPSPLLSNLDSIKNTLQEMLSKNITSFDINQAWEFADALRRLLLLLGDDGYIFARLLNEARKNGIEGSKTNWKAFLDEDKLKNLIQVYEAGTALTNVQRTQAIESISLIYGARADSGRYQRATIDLKTRYLGRLRTTLTVLLILLLLVAFFVVQRGFSLSPTGTFPMGWFKSIVNFPFRYFFNEEQIRYLLLAAFAGGIGSVLSGFFKLRDNVSKLSDLRSFKAAMSAQPFVGATIGILFYLIILGGIFRLGLTNADPSKPAETFPWALIGVYCFIAGFSEPFFLGVVNSVAGAAEKKVSEDLKDSPATKTGGAGNP